MTNFASEGQFGNSGTARSAGDASESGVAVAAASGPEPIREQLAGKFVCPFCGSINESEQGVCPRCTMENSPASRKATKSRIGPWYVLQTRNPAAPGMKFETLLNFARKGRVKPRSIVRGPTSHQLWKFAAQVKGLSREFGVCYSCGGSIEATTSLCPQCNRLQDPPANPDVLLETKDAPALPVTQRPSRNKEPDLAEVDAEFVIPALGGTASDDSMSGLSLTGSMAGVAFDPAPRNETPIPKTISGAGAAAPPVFASTGPGIRSNKKDEGFLSPKDLAAAFKLNFTPAAEAEASEPAARAPAAERRRAPRGPAEPRSGYNGFNGDDRRPQRQRHPLDFQPHRAAPAADPTDVLAAPRYDAGTDEALALSRPARKPAAKPEPGPRRPHRFRFLKVLVFLVVFGGALYGTAVFLDPTLRQQSIQYGNQAKTAVLKWINGSKPDTEPAAPAPASPAGPDSTDTADVSDSGASATPIVPGNPHPDTSPSGTPDHGSDAQPASASAPPTPAAPTPAPLPPTRQAPDLTVGTPVTPPSAVRPAATSPVVATPPTAAVNPSPPPAAVPAAPPPPPIDPSVESRRLYGEAIKLSSTNPARAITLFKDIKKLPPQYWYTDLDVRIQAAENLLKSQQH